MKPFPAQISPHARTVTLFADAPLGYLEAVRGALALPRPGNQDVASGIPGGADAHRATAAAAA